jgi:phosphoribosyl-AMP cyclohydrolase
MTLRPATLDPAVAERLTRDPAGLVPAIVQQHDTGEVLMLAWMNDEALGLTLSTGRATYFSRSRGRLWVKGETSGHHQYVRSVALDCDGDTLLLRVDQVGPACHTGQRTCFFTNLPLSTSVTQMPLTADHPPQTDNRADTRTEGVAL